MGKFVDLTGKTFGRLIVLYRIENKGKYVQWYARCSCGAEINVTTHSLTGGSTKSCGCLQKETSRNNTFKDLTGIQFERLTVIGLSSKRTKRNLLWECSCSCGAIILASTHALTCGRTKSCGCHLQDNRDTNFKNKYLGKTFGYLTAIGKGGYKIKCQCICGNIVSVLGGSLLNGDTKSCGCKKEELRMPYVMLDLNGQTFNRLTVLEKIGKKNGSDAIYWLCRCSCGNLHEVRGSSLINGEVKSCGCLRNEMNAEANTTHGMSKTSEYRIQKDRKRREIEIIADSNWTLEMELGLRDLYPTCVVCGMTENEHLTKYGTRLHVDHVYPLSKNYGLEPGNAVVLCQKCNGFKHNKLPDDLPEPMKSLILKAAEYFYWYWNQPDPYEDYEYEDE